MEFRVDCPCGEHIMVSEGAAGVTFECVCGKPIVVPSLSELRTRAGLPTNAVSPEFIVEHFLVAGEIPGGNGCVDCGGEPADVVHIETECERVWKQRSGGFSWTAAVLLLIFCQPLLIYYLFWFYVYGDRGVEKEFGRDKIYALPLRICPQCRPRLNDPVEIKRCLRRIPEYDLLLEKFPAAIVRVTV